MSCPVTGKTGTCPTSGKQTRYGGGCPVLGSQVPDPPLEVSDTFPCFVSLLYEFSITYKGMPPMKPEEFKEKRKNFDKYPLFLKHSLFHGEDYLKIRKSDVTHKYFIFDDLR